MATNRLRCDSGRYRVACCRFDVDVIDGEAIKNIIICHLVGNQTANIWK